MNLSGNVKSSTGASQKLNLIGKTQLRKQTDLKTYWTSLFVQLIPVSINTLQKLFGLKTSHVQISHN